MRLRKHSMSTHDASRVLSSKLQKCIEYRRQVGTDSGVDVAERGSREEGGVECYEECSNQEKVDIIKNKKDSALCEDRTRYLSFQISK